MTSTARQITFGEAICDPRLIGSEFAHEGDRSSWEYWVTVIRAALGEELSRHERNVLKKVSGSRNPPKQAVRELWAIVGRRAGKSRIASALAVYLACFVDHSHLLVPGETGFILVLAVDKQQAGVILRYIAGLLEASDILRTQVRRRTTTDIDLVLFGAAITISVQTNSFRSVRGKTLIAAIFEEVSYWRDEQSATPDVETYRAIMPGLATTGGLLIGISSPYRRAGLLFQKHVKHFGKDDDDVLVVQGASRVFNNTLPQSVVDAALRDDPVAAASEWLGEFRNDIAGFLDQDLLASLVRPSPLELPPRPDTRYIAFTDASGGRGDSFSIAVGHEADDRTVIDLCRAVKPPFDPARVVGDYAKLLGDYGVHKVTGDAYSAGWVEGAFREQGIRYLTSKPSASEIYRESLPCFTRGLIELPNDPKLLAELGSLERRTGPSGRETITHPVGAHDDMANSVCGVAHLLSSRAKPSDIDYQRDSIIAGELKSRHADWEIGDRAWIHHGDGDVADVIRDYYPALASRDPWEL